MRSIHFLLITLAVSRFAAAQSFQCKLAKSPREQAVCSHEKLSALDSAVSAAYKSLRAQLSSNPTSANGCTGSTSSVPHMAKESPTI